MIHYISWCIFFLSKHFEPVNFGTSGLRSRCTTPWRWQNATTFNICTNTVLASSSEYFPPLQHRRMLFYLLLTCIFLDLVKKIYQQSKLTRLKDKRICYSYLTPGTTLKESYPKARLLHIIWNSKRLSALLQKSNEKIKIRKSNSILLVATAEKIWYSNPYITDILKKGTVMWCTWPRLLMHAKCSLS